MKIEISQNKDGLYSVETESQIASRLMWHEMIMLMVRMTAPDSLECLAWLEDKNLFAHKPKTNNK